MVEIYFDDLTHSKQKELLDEFGFDSPEQANWDLFPICTLESEE